MSVRQSAEAARRRAARGFRVLFLPPESPDCSPIDQAFSTLKASVRRTGARPRAALEEAIAAGLATITAADAQAEFAHCGYPIPAQLF